MKTVLIYDQLLEEPLKFLVVDGDRSHLNDCYINAWIAQTSKLMKSTV